MQLIEHEIYGKGKILRQRYGGFELYVEFEDGIRRWVRSNEVRFLSETPILKKYKHSGNALSKEQFKAREIIEALRLGIMPQKYVEEFTFGRDKEINYVKNWLNNSHSNSFLITGEYGVGKTHLLEYIYWVALRNNWAVSMVELDPDEASFHKPRNIYQNITSSFRYKLQNGNFREFLREIASLNDSFHKIKNHVYLGEVIKRIRNGTVNDDIWEWIEGNPVWYIYPRMYSYSTCANIYCYILSGIGWAAKNILKKNGLLIIFDEAETIDPYWYTTYQSNKAVNFFKGLMLMAENVEALLKEVLEDEFYEHSTYKGWWGKYTDLQYCGYSRLPFIWNIPSYVKIIFTFTSIPWILYKLSFNNLKPFEITPIKNETLMKISEQIVNLYQIAYKFHLNKDQVVKTFGLIRKDKTRSFIKDMVEALDLMRFYPDKSIEELLMK